MPIFHRNTFRRLRVIPDASGELHVPADSADLDPESYWDDLLSDPRGRVRSGPSYWQRLAARQGGTLILACDKCPTLQSTYRVDELLQKFSGSMHVSAVASSLAGCGKHAKRCHLTWNLLPRNT